MIEVVLFEPEIPFNTGNVGRLCLANNIRLHLVKPLGFLLDNKHVRRAGMDYWEHVDVMVHDSYTDCQQYLGTERNYYYLTTKTDKPYWDIEFGDSDVLVFGPESRGLPKELLSENSDSLLTIPMYNKTGPTGVRSLNLSSSVGIVVYEALRQLKIS